MPLARFDDLHGAADGGGAWEFVDAISEDFTHELDQVLSCLRRAEDAASGAWVTLAISYEAAAAFDSSLITRDSAPSDPPLIWWRSFRGRVPAAALGREDFLLTELDLSSTEHYPRTVEQVRSLIAAGEVYQVNAALPIRAHLSGSRFGFYSALAQAQQGSHNAYLELPEHTIASASPELFFEWTGDELTCRPMKGTRPRHEDEALDAAGRQDLVTSPKEHAENLMIVDLLRNDLARIAAPGSVEVSDLFAIEAYPTVWQMTSKVTATTKPAADLIEILKALFPCGSITGAPKVTAMRAIADLEPQPRGIYCGAIGWLAPPAHEGARARFSVPIRTAVIDHAGQLTYKAGAGITWPSDPHAETAEVIAKAQVLVRLADQITLLETFGFDGQAFPNLDLHLNRLSRSAHELGIELPPHLREQITEALSSTNGPQRVRLTLSAVGEVSLATQPFVPETGPVRLEIDEHPHDETSLLHRLKTVHRDCIEAAAAAHPEADEVILLNRSGDPMDTTRSNLTYRIGDQWFTPDAAQGGLPGIGLQLLLASGSVSRRPTTLDDIINADQLRVVNSLRGWRDAQLNRLPAHEQSLG